MKILLLAVPILAFMIIDSNRVMENGRLQVRAIVHPAVESGYIEVDGGKIFYEAAGQGPVILMVHDGLLHRETWDVQFPTFAKNFRVIRWDRRGYGRSDIPKAPYSDLDDLLVLLKTLKVERATIMGCSAGGSLSIHLTLDHPELVSSLILIGPIVSGFDFSDHFIKRGDRGMPNNNAPVEQKIEYWTSRDPWIIAPENLAAKKRMKELLSANPQNLSIPWQFNRWPANPALGRLSQIKVPTLIVVGESDVPDVHAHVGAIQSGITNSKRVVLTKSGHLPLMEVSSAFNRVILDFLQSVK
ncbi:MAG: alpha/beta hydrolase [Acidobacteria bacterium]|nr:alpha/beta hydrolase [Acidobacteriota bacterium]